MTLYSLYARENQAPNQAPVAVADRFAWSAALVPPLYAIVHGLWLMLGLWVVKVVVLAALSPWLGGEAVFWLYLLLAVWFGFAAAGFRRHKADKLGLYRGDWIAEREDAAAVSYLKAQGVR